MNQGLKFLKAQAQKNNVNMQDYSKVSIIPFLAFEDQVVDLMKKYISKPQCTTWGEFISVALTDKQFSNLYASWIKYNKKSLQSKLISILLPTTSISKLSLFLKLRKFVLKTSSKPNSCLDNISLQHEDIIGILHSVYNSNESRKVIMQGMKALFISYKIQQAKIYSCIFIQYALSVHEDIHSREYNEATVQNQTNNYGTIPQSIFGYSSIISHHSNAHQQQFQNQNNPSKMSKIGNSNVDNSRKYISNFQSVIHQQNGLYRKVKSSQVSVHGYKIIDHKFHNDSHQIQQSKSRINQQFSNQVISRMQRSRGQESIDNINQSRSRSNNQGITNKDNSIYIQDNNNQEVNNARTPLKNAHQPRRRATQQQNVSRNSRNNIYNSGNKSIQSLTYSQKYKSPNMSLQYTPDSYSKSLLSNTKGNLNMNMTSNTKPRHQSSSGIKLIKVQENVGEEDDIKPKEGGYSMFKRMIERNRSFMEKMLRAEYSRNQSNEKLNINRQLSLSGQKQDGNNEPYENNEPINVIHDSIVRHSKIDRWQPQQPKQTIH